MRKCILIIILSLFSAPLIFGQTSKIVTYSILERKIVDTIIKLKEVKERAQYVKDQTKGKRHLQYTIWEKPTKETPYYWVKVIEDNGFAYYTHFNFYVYPKTMTIKFLDTVNNEIFDLNTWRKKGGG